MDGKGTLVIISGPSGAGKSTVVDRLLATCPLPLKLSISATTRAPRAGEQDGVNYWFLTDEEFQRRQSAGAFLECKEVFAAGHWYGTLKSEVEAGWADGKVVILEIDVEGAMAVIDRVPEAVTLFLHPGSTEELERRLRGRATDTDEAISRRLEVARRELAYLPRYKYEVINESVDQAAREICELLGAAAAKDVPSSKE